ncbi:MAG: NAD(P)H-hydrate dehydratase [Chloroflexi bacterium]|nr:NAD(P)H-hydrate dehydratase [Chloroflexota bacterium]
MKIVTVEQMIGLERKSAELGAPPDFLMENAGLAVAESARGLLGDVRDRSVVVLIGPGNNGGDGLVAARHLHDWGGSVRLFLVKRKTEEDENFALCMERSISWIDASSRGALEKFDEVLSSADMFIDSLFGTGKVRPLEGMPGEMLKRVSAARLKRPELKILAVDLPSGLNADTGEVDPATLTADLTVTFAYPKIGLFRFPGAARLGRLEIADIGIPDHLAQGITTELITSGMVRNLLPPRPLNANKGTFGKLLVVAGSANYIGAAYLACEAAMRVGTGLVTLATPRSLQPILASKLVETTYLPLPESEHGVIDSDAESVIRGQVAGYDAMLLGCGLGQHEDTIEFVRKVLLGGFVNIPLVVDADGLNAVARSPKWWQKLPNRTVLTPHAGEMSRLTGKSVTDIQNERLDVARKGAHDWNQTVVLKGAHTVVASPDGRARICGAANPGLASAGTGDVLAGVIGGLLAQGLMPFAAATCGVYIHAMAGELVKAEIGDTGMVASDLLLASPVVIKELKENPSPLMGEVR